ncbi:MAG: MATE family efflux transporter [Planctomycetota bacterium]
MTGVETCALQFSTIARLFRVGLPNFLESLGMWFGNFLVMMMVGAIAVATASEGLFGAHILAIRVEAFSFLPGFAMGTAVATLAGQYLGAGSAHLARVAILRCTLIGAGVMGLMGAAFILMPKLIIGALSPQPIHLELAPPLLVICGFVQVPFAIALVIRSALRGAGDVKVVMWLTWISTYLIRLPLAWLLCGVDITIPASIAGLFGAEAAWVIQNPSGLEPSLRGLWLGLCIELGIRSVIFAARLIHGGWAHARV